MSRSEFCFECGDGRAVAEGLCRCCLAELQKSNHKMDIYLMDNWTE